MVYPSIANNSGYFKSHSDGYSLQRYSLRKPKIRSVYTQVLQNGFDSLAHTACFFLGINLSKKIISRWLAAKKAITSIRFRQAQSMTLSLQRRLKTKDDTWTKARM